MTPDFSHAMQSTWRLNGFEQADCGSSARCQRAAVFLEGLEGLATPHEMVPDKLSLSMVDRGREIYRRGTVLNLEN